MTNMLLLVVNLHNRFTASEHFTKNHAKNIYKILVKFFKSSRLHFLFAKRLKSKDNRPYYFLMKVCKR